MRVDDIGDHIRCSMPGGRSLVTVGMPGVTNTSQFSAISCVSISVICLSPFQSYGMVIFLVGPTPQAAHGEVYSPSGDTGSPPARRARRGFGLYASVADRRALVARSREGHSCLLSLMPFELMVMS